MVSANDPYDFLAVHRGMVDKIAESAYKKIKTEHIFPDPETTDCNDNVDQGPAVEVNQFVDPEPDQSNEGAECSDGMDTCDGFESAESIESIENHQEILSRSDLLDVDVDV